MTKAPATEARNIGRRAVALSRERIIEAAIAILDADGEGALTFRVLAARLATGSGAIYWHVSDKNELLAAAADAVVADVVTPIMARSEAGDGAGPREAIRATALDLFDAVDAHPWVGTQLHREPWRSAMPRVLEGFGGPLQALGVPERAQFHAVSALVNYVLGVAGQNAANARLHPPGTDRSAFLATVAARWAQLDATAYPFVHRMTAQLGAHDDREQFLAGIDLILAGIETLR